MLQLPGTSFSKSFPKTDEDFRTSVHSLYLKKKKNHLLQGLLVLHCAGVPLWERGRRPGDIYWEILHLK